ncbi:MAG: tRNA pseudouridine(38-40) synthase TruA, partial [Gammaproteobacteria bacterium]
MPRIALGIEYDGTDFAGWQSQANARSVQAELERSVSRVADEAVVVNAAGRTDAGVHAAGQVAHFDT